jgi:hypothetical protein
MIQGNLEPFIAFSRAVHSFSALSRKNIFAPTVYVKGTESPAPWGGEHFPIPQAPGV